MLVSWIKLLSPVLVLCLIISVKVWAHPIGNTNSACFDSITYDCPHRIGGLGHYTSNDITVAPNGKFAIRSGRLKRAGSLSREELARLSSLIAGVHWKSVKGDTPFYGTLRRGVTVLIGKHEYRIEKDCLPIRVPMKATSGDTHSRGPGQLDTLMDYLDELWDRYAP